MLYYFEALLITIISRTTHSVDLKIPDASSMLVARDFLNKDQHVNINIVIFHDTMCFPITTINNEAVRVVEVN